MGDRGGVFVGSLAGAVAWNFSVAMAVQFPEPGWSTARGVEFLSGAILGALLWGGVAISGRFGRRRWINLLSFMGRRGGVK